MIKWQYRDDRDWTDVDGIVTDMTNYAIKYKDTSIHPAFMEPVKTKDTWNGVEHDIQHKRYDVYEFQINIKESEKKSLSQIMSCSDQRIIDYEENSSGSIINQEYIFDTSNFDNIEIEEIENNIAQTSGASYKIRFRTNRTIINKCLPISNTNTLSLQKSTKEWELYKLAEIDTSYGKITKLSETSVAYYNGGSLYKFKIVEDVFVQEGAALYVPFSGGIYDLTSLDENSVALIYSGQGILQTYTFSNGWSATGNYLDIAGNVLDPVICALSATLIVLYDSTIGEMRAYSFDGTDWSQAGSSFTLAVGATTYDICKMTSTKIAIAVASGNYLRSYDFNGSVFSLDQSYTINSMSNISISRLSDSRIILLDGGTDTLRSYTLSGTWSADIGGESLTSITPICEALTSFKIFAHNTSNDGFYTYGQYDYYTDYDVIDYSESIDPIKIEFPDGSSKIARTIDKKGESILIYLATSNYDDFITYLKTTSLFYINDTLVTEYNHEDSEIAEGIWRVVFNGIETVTPTNFNLAPNSTYSITMNSAAITYYSDYPIETVTRPEENIIVKWPDGKDKTARTIIKKAYQFTTFTTTPEIIIENVNKYNDVTISGSVLTEIQSSVEEIALGLFKLVIDGVYDTDLTDFNLAPLGTYTLSMNSGGITYTSDYPYYDRIRDVQKIDVEWDDGSTKTLQTVKKLSYEFVYFTSDPQTFIKNVGTYADATLNSKVLTEIDTTQEEIALNLFKIVLNGVHTLDVDTIYSFPVAGTLLRITDTTPTNHDYYTDYDVMLINEGSEKNTIKNQTGVNVTTKGITKEVKQAKFFLTETNAFALKKWAELFKPGWTCSLAGSTVYEIVNGNNIEPIKIGVNLYEVNINCLMAVTTN